MIEVVNPAAVPLRGALRVPGDKSLSHRAVLFASMAEGTSHLTGVLDSDDVRSTITACEALGAHIVLDEPHGEEPVIRVTGWGARGPEQPEHDIDCGNSGTTARLLMGVLAGWPLRVTLKGDASLTRRPMRRVTEPLSLMGAHFETDTGTLPVTVHGASVLEPLSYASPVASAQVKTAILLAGTRAEGRTHVTEPHLSRDHTERLLPAFGVTVTEDAAPGASVYGPAVLKATDVAVPGDPSSAAFFAVAAMIVPGSEVTLRGISLNPTRIGCLYVLERMGVPGEGGLTHEAGAEPVGDITVRFAEAPRATTITAAEVPTLVDEVPILALAASQAHGTTRFEGVGELRVKESDRLTAIADGLAAFGVTVRAGEDWLEVDGPAQLHGTTLDSLGDHRLAMTWAVAGLIAEGETTIEDWDAVSVSYPGFARDLSSLLEAGAE